VLARHLKLEGIFIVNKPSLTLCAILIALGCATACGAPVASNISGNGNDQAQQAIVNGWANQGFTAVGLLTNAAPGGALARWCTATLVNRSTILTAAHCVMGLDAENNTQPTLANPSSVVFHLGNISNGASTTGQDFEAAAINVPSGFNFTQFIDNAENGETNDNDLAVVKLSGVPDVQGTLPAIETAALGPQALGVNLQLVGYGSDDTNTDTSSTGIKRYTNAPILSYDNYIFRAGTTSGTCAGDSGGPAFYNGVIVGVTQAGPANPGGVCGGNDYFTRVDAWQQFILNAP
jgi:secreted trypsin-like serine protease